MSPSDSEDGQKSVTTLLFDMAISLILRATALVLVFAAMFAPPSQAAPIRVAVLDFADTSPTKGKQEWGAGLRAMVTTDLAQLGQFSVVERERLADIRAELKLQRSKLVDKRTAVRVGKLAGATHLVSGALTVVGKKMRLDCRLFAVKSGEILLASNVDGEVDAFFELEKELVKQLVRGAGVKLAPMERAKIAKIHTADLRAFRSFSKGVYAFDNRKYADAVSALRKASRFDANFQLAQVTLARYEQIIRQIEGRATAGRAEEAQLKRLQGDKQTRLIAKVIGRLMKKVRAKGRTFDRLLALHLLADIYRGRQSALRAFRDRSDAFDNARMVDHLSQAYWADAGKFRGRLPAMNDRPLDVKLPASMSDFGRYWADAVKTAKQRSGPRLAGAQHGLIRPSSRLSAYHDYARNLHLDGLQEAELFETLYQRGTGKPKHPCTKYLAGSKAGVKQCLRKWETGALITVGLEYRRAMALDRSTSYLVRASNLLKEPRALDRIANELKRNRDLSAAFRNAPREKRRFLRELALLQDLRITNRIHEQESSYFQKRLQTKRGWPNSYLLIGNTPTWPIYGRTDLGTGPRSDRYRADRFHYYDSRGSQALVVTGSRKRNRFRANFIVHRATPKRFDNRDKANLRFVFGLQNLQRVTNVKGKGWQSLRNPTGYAIAFTNSHLEVIRLVGSHIGFRDKIEFRDHAIKRFRFSGSKKYSVQVTVNGRNLTVVANRNRYQLRLPAARKGYLGFAFDGAGYAGISKLRLRK